MRTHNLALMTVIFLVVGGLLSGFSVQKSGQSLGLIEERAIPGAGSPAFVQTAQGANLDASQISEVDSAAVSSLSSISDLSDGGAADLAFSPIAYSAAYATGAVRALGYISPSLSR